MLDLLKAVSKGGVSVGQMAIDLGIDKNSLMDRLYSLERMGYLQKMDLEGECGSGSCKNCPVNRSCESGLEVRPVIFILTKKGKRVLMKANSGQIDQ